MKKNYRKALKPYGIKPDHIMGVSTKAYKTEIQDLIRMKAYELYLRKGCCTPGNAIQDWIEAEKRIVGAHDHDRLYS